MVTYGRILMAVPHRYVNEETVQHAVAVAKSGCALPRPGAAGSGSATIRELRRNARLSAN